MQRFQDGCAGETLSILSRRSSMNLWISEYVEVSWLFPSMNISAVLFGKERRFDVSELGLSWLFLDFSHFQKSKNRTFRTSIAGKSLTINISKSQTLVSGHKHIMHPYLHGWLDDVLLLRCVLLGLDGRKFRAQRSWLDNWTNELANSQPISD